MPCCRKVTAITRRVCRQRDSTTPSKAAKPPPRIRPFDRVAEAPSTFSGPLLSIRRRSCTKSWHSSCPSGMQSNRAIRSVTRLRSCSPELMNRNTSPQTAESANSIVAPGTSAAARPAANRRESAGNPNPPPIASPAGPWYIRPTSGDHPQSRLRHPGGHAEIPESRLARTTSSHSQRGHEMTRRVAAATIPPCRTTRFQFWSARSQSASRTNRFLTNTCNGPQISGHEENKDAPAGRQSSGSRSVERSAYACQLRDGYVV